MRFMVVTLRCILGGTLLAIGVVCFLYGLLAILSTEFSPDFETWWMSTVAGVVAFPIAIGFLFLGQRIWPSEEKEED